jgi:hypothetical protein
MSEQIPPQIMYREYREEDAQDVLDLFNHVFNKHLSMNRWLWEHTENPIVPTQFNLAMCKAKPIGQSAAVPLLFNHEGITLNTVRVQNAMVHPDFRKQGVFLHTLKNLTSQVYEKQIEFIYTFPNDRSIGAFVKRLDYRHIFDIFTYNLPVNLISKYNNQDIRCEFDKKVNFIRKDIEFINSQLNSFSIFNHRNLDYMNWRYHINSTNNYLVVRVFQGDKQLGLIVCKPYNETMAIDLVELYMIADKHTIGCTLKAICEFYKNDIVRSLNVWSMPHYPLHPDLLDLGFTKTEHSTHVVSKPLSTRVSQNWDRLDAYYLSMGDSDVY